jgi:hypothetical protein
MVEAKLLRKKLKNGLIVDKWDLVTIIEKQQAEIEALKAKTLTDEDIAKVVYELNQKANTPERWVTAMQIGAETIIQLRDELRKAQGD